jgi:hypothetical protein
MSEIVSESTVSGDGGRLTQCLKVCHQSRNLECSGQDFHLTRTILFH